MSARRTKDGLNWASPLERAVDQRDDACANYSLTAIPARAIVVEGPTDRRHLLATIAVLKRLTSADWGVAEGGEPVEILVPTGPRAAGRAGASEVARFGQAVWMPYCHLGEPKTIAFILDSDTAGESAAVKLEERGYDRGTHVFPLARCGQGVEIIGSDRSVCIEDLLSMRIQSELFDSGQFTAQVDYRRGKRVRIRWLDSEAKMKLCQMVEEVTDPLDVIAIIHLLREVREAWGLPVEEEVALLLEDLEPRVGLDTHT